MTTLETVRPTPALEALIDARLDTIDRMLLDVLPRQDRLAILRDVESQIHEQLQARAADELSRADVLAVLAALDPPEAYLPEHSDDAAPRPARTVRMSRAVATTPLEPGLRSAASSERGRSSALL
ncbi:MAG TPA: hypothetical protein VHR72_09415, partial [Gemmataceae bacterium]|nr:hypothetical protein [Gemmataceae bacterium]